jgi:hypothetical protein
VNPELEERMGLLSFWKWFFYGMLGLRPGWRRLADRFLWLHGFIGVTLATQVAYSVSQVAEKILFPLAGILIGTTCAWAGCLHALLQSEHMREVERKKKGMLAEFSLCYLLTVFLGLVVLCLWGLCGLGFFQGVSFVPASFRTGQATIVAKSFLYALTSLSLRTTWQSMLLVHRAFVMEGFIRRTKELSKKRFSARGKRKTGQQ